jgi:hypothetical protein
MSETTDNRPYCKQGLCMNHTENGYCNEHGGFERQEREWANQAAREQDRLTQQGQKPKGQAVPTGQGLSKLCNDEAELARRREAKRKKRADKEAKRKAERQARGPKKRKGDKNDKNKKKAKKDEKADKKAMKNAAKQ